MLEAYEQLKTLIMSIEEDVRKAAGGNRAAGTRVRKHMQDIKNKAQELRVKVLEDRDTGSTPGSTPGTTTETPGGQAGRRWSLIRQPLDMDWASALDFGGWLIGK